MNNDYRLVSNLTTLNHYTCQGVIFARDGSDFEESDAMKQLIEGRNHDLHIYVKSGEYFTTLATILDGISEHPELQQIVHDLLYLQQHYKIVKK